MNQIAMLYGVPYAQLYDECKDIYGLPEQPTLQQVRSFMDMYTDANRTNQLHLQIQFVPVGKQDTSTKTYPIHHLFVHLSDPEWFNDLCANIGAVDVINTKTQASIKKYTLADFEQNGTYCYVKTAFAKDDFKVPEKYYWGVGHIVQEWWSQLVQHMENTLIHTLTIQVQNHTLHEYLNGAQFETAAFTSARKWIETTDLYSTKIWCKDWPQFAVQYLCVNSRDVDKVAKHYCEYIWHHVVLPCKFMLLMGKSFMVDYADHILDSTVEQDLYYEVYRVMMQLLVQYIFSTHAEIDGAYQTIMEYLKNTDHHLTCAHLGEVYRNLVRPLQIPEATNKESRISKCIGGIHVPWYYAHHAGVLCDNHGCRTLSKSIMQNRLTPIHYDDHSGIREKIDSMFAMDRDTTLQEKIVLLHKDMSSNLQSNKSDILSTDKLMTEHSWDNELMLCIPPNTQNWLFIDPLHHIIIKGDGTRQSFVEIHYPQHCTSYIVI
jgi:hypothetical protein